MFTRFKLLKFLNSLTIEIEKIKTLRDIIVSLEDIYNILRYLVSLSISRKRFARIFYILILFSKTRLSRLDLIVFLLFLDTFRASPSLFINLSLSSLLSLDFNSLIKSLNNFIDDVDKFIKFFFNKKFVNKNKKKKEDKKKKKKEENEKRDVEKKNNKNEKFF